MKKENFVDHFKDHLRAHVYSYLAALVISVTTAALHKIIPQHAVSDSKSTECLNVAVILVRTDEAPKAIQLIKQRCKSIKSPNLRSDFIQAALVWKGLESIREEIEKIRVESYEQADSIAPSPEDSPPDSSKKMGN